MDYKKEAKHTNACIDIKKYLASVETYISSAEHLKRKFIFLIAHALQILLKSLVDYLWMHSTSSW